MLTAIKWKRQKQNLFKSISKVIFQALELLLKLKKWSNVLFGACFIPSLLPRPLQDKSNYISLKHLLYPDVGMTPQDSRAGSREEPNMKLPE